MGFNVKNTTIISIFDLIAPHTCRGCGRIGNILCERCKKDILAHHHNFCPICKRKNKDGICKNCHNLPPTYVISDRNSLVGDLIKELKYHSVRSLSCSLAGMLDTILPINNQKIVIIPLPTIDSHIRERGLDHTLLIAKNIAKKHQNVTVEKAIIRTKNTVQVGADRKTRITQAKNAYQIKPNFRPDQKTRYILLDDIWTTGASIKSCIEILQKSGVKNIAVALLAVSSLD